MNDLTKTFIETQMAINSGNNEQFSLIIKQLGNLIGIIEDHENDMEKMANEINELKKQLSERES